VDAWFNRGFANELAGDYKNAYTDYKMTLKLKPITRKRLTAEPAG